MDNNLTSPLWKDTMEKIRICHLSLIGAENADDADWEDAFESLIKAIKSERRLNPAFATELSSLTEDSGASYSFEDILEEYFDYLEEKEHWQAVIDSCDEVIALFKWEKRMPSEYNFRIGNALNKMGEPEKAEAFGKAWLDRYPQDLYAAASNVFIKAELKKFDEAEAITEKYLKSELVCDDKSDTFFMAAYRLYELTDNINAKQRIEKKIAEYNEMLGK